MNNQKDVYLKKSDCYLPITIAVTGHRDISPEEIPHISKQFSEWLVKLATDYPYTPLRLLSGLAEGSDRIASRCFLEVKNNLSTNANKTTNGWELIAVLPMNIDAYREDFSENVTEFDQLCSQASSIITLPSPPLASLQSNKALRDSCYEVLGAHLARHCNVLVAFWDGSYNDLRGGTSSIVQLKLEGQWQATTNFSIAMHDCGPVWHLPVSRRSSKSPSIISEKGNASWKFPSDPAIDFESFSKELRSIEEFNLLLHLKLNNSKMPDFIDSLSPSKDCGHLWLQSLNTLDRRVIGVHVIADLIAVDRERIRHQWLVAIYVLGSALAICLWTAIDNVLQIWMSLGYIILVAALYFSVRRIRAPDLSEAPLSYRFLAESLRIQIYWSIAHTVEGRHSTTDEIPFIAGWEILRVLDALLSQQAQEIGWVREALRIGAINPASGSGLSEQTKREFIGHWIKDQLKYYTRAEKRHKQRVRKLEDTSLILALFAIASAVGVVYIDMTEFPSHELRHFFAILAAVLPAIALLIQSYSDRMALEEQQKSSSRMQSVFLRAQTAFDLRKFKAKFFAHFVRALGQEALAECAYWLVLRKSKPPKMPT